MSQSLFELRQHYDIVHASVEVKASTRHQENAIWKQILNRFGPDKPVRSFTRTDILQLKADMRETPVQANRTIALLSHAFNLAEDWGWRDQQSNPCHRVKRYRELPRTRYPSDDEAARLMNALFLWKEKQPWFVGMVLLLIMTGCRRMEIQGARREWIQGDRLVLPDSKTGAKIVPLNSQAQAIIRGIPKVQGNPYLIVGRRPGQHLISPGKLWKELLDEAGIEKLHMHDLRRFFASVAISSGNTLEQTMQLMGHTQAQTTKRYAFLMSKQKIDAMQTAGDEMMNILKKRPANLTGQV